MLADIVEHAHTGIVFRVDAFADPRQTLTADGCTQSEIDEIVSFTRLGLSEVNELVFRIFRPLAKEQPYKAGRFGDGKTYPVLYCAAEHETSCKEKLHYLAADEWFERGFVHAFSLIEIDVAGRAKDLRNSNYSYDDLVAEDRVVCRQIGADAYATGIAILLSYSARATDGITTPIFNRDCIQGVVIRNDVLMAAGFPAPQFQIVPTSSL
jgi:hypothetical protein